MKHLIISITFAFSWTPYLIGQNSKVNRSDTYRTPNMKSHYCEGITLIPGQTFIKNQMASYDHYTSHDTTLLYAEPIMRVSVPSFYISDHEVTNAEYREFVNWVRDSIARIKLFCKSSSEEKHLWGKYANSVTKNKDHSGNYFVINWDTKLDYGAMDIVIMLQDMYVDMHDQFYKQKQFDVGTFFYYYETIRNGDTISTSINIYPDTLCWTKDGYGYFDPMVKNYFWHTAYDNYPVVGVSWTQAQAYCDWRTKRYLEELNTMGNKKKRKHLEVKFTLPNNRQWSYACEPNGIKTLPYVKNESGCYTSNFGNIYLNSGIVIKDYRDDGAFYTVKVKSYLGNEFGLYNMFGNVAEWIQDNPTARPENFFENLMEISRYSTTNFLKFRTTSEDLLKDNPNDATESKGNQHWRNVRDTVVSAPQELYVTDPYTKSTQLVIKDSPEHKRILEKRLLFYNISPNASVDDILENYKAFHSVDSTFREKIFNLQKKEEINASQKEKQTQSTDKNTFPRGVVITEEIPIPRFNNPLELYNNYSGCFETEEKIWAEQKLVRLIRELKHNWEVIERAEKIQTQVLDIQQKFGGIEPVEQIQIPTNEETIKTCRLVKGGSWVNQPHYLNTACNEVYHESETSSKIGFRVVMEASVIEVNGICYNCVKKDRKNLKNYRKIERQKDMLD